MSFNANTYRTKKSALKNYGASPNFVNATMWQHTTTGLELVDATDELPFKVLIVGRISAFRLKSGPGGNHVLNGLGSLNKAKYQFHMSRPADADLAKDYNAAIAAMETLQKQVATTKDQRNMVITDVTGKMIRFVRNVFELRVRRFLRNIDTVFLIHSRRMSCLTRPMDAQLKMRQRWTKKQRTGRFQKSL